MTAAETTRPSLAPSHGPRVADHTDVDLSDPASFATGVPHEAFGRLRRHAPVAWHDEHEASESTLATAIGIGLRSCPGFWAVTSHAAVNEVSRSPQDFSSRLGGTSMIDLDDTGLAMFRQMMLNMDGPDHSRLRRILQPLFTPRVTRALHDAIEININAVIDEVTLNGACDFVTAIAAELPTRVLADLLGMPRDDRHLIFEWSNAIIGMEDPEYGGNAGEAMASLAQLFRYGQQVADARRAEPRDDIISLIANAEVEGDRLSDVEFSMFWLLLIIAGNETTRNALSGSLIALHEHDQWDRLRANPDLLPSAVEELVRYVSPVMHFRRTATRDLTLGDVAIRAGDKVVIWYPSANRDETVFANPDTLDLARTPNPHLGFGVGAHFCLGAHLARLELTSALQTLTSRLPDLRIDEPAERVQSNFINGIKHLPVVFTPERAAAS